MMLYTAASVLALGATLAAGEDSDASSRQVHLAFAGGNASSMAVGWLGPKAAAGAAAAAGVVRFGSAPDLLDRTAAATTRQSLTHTHYDAVLRDLNPNSTVFYRAGSDPRVHAFGTAAPDRHGAFKCSVLGDMGINNSAATIVRMLARTSHAFVLHVGDVSYADDSGSIEPDPGGGVVPFDGGLGYEALYDRFGAGGSG
jgi:phosphodiesterase/alkaline phosphatase D-like protein